jgi:dihydrofolate synthase / folylpolyglutamate synthase
MASPAGASPKPPIAHALDYLKTFTDWEQKLPGDPDRAFDLGGVRRLLAKLGDPHLGRPQIHVAGTKGKGSVVHFADSILGAHGVRTLRFLSPHVERINERIAIGGEDVPDDRLAAAIFAVRPAIEELARERAGEPPTFFEVLTAAAFAAAREARVDADVVEVGLGGRLDATNVIDPTVAVITSIDLDHTKVLGDTREKIAAEKAGIIKPRKPVLTGLDRGKPGFRVIQERALAQDAPLAHVGGGIEVETRGFARGAGGRPGVRFGGRVGRVDVQDAVAPGGGLPQATNALLALGAAEAVLDALGRRLDVARALLAIEATPLPARAEAFGTRVTVLLDGAHTAASCASLADLAAWFFQGRRTVLLAGLTADRSPRPLFAPFRKIAQHAVFAPIRSPRSADPARLAEAWRAVEGTAESASGGAEALELALRAAGNGGAIVTAGSFYLAGEIRPALRRLP